MNSGHGNALWVRSSIYNACRFFEMFQKTDIARKLAIITSYKPSPGDIKGEESGEGTTEKLRQYEIYRKMLATSALFRTSPPTKRARTLIRKRKLVVTVN